MIWLLYALLAVLGILVLLVAVAAVRTAMIPVKVTDYRLSDDTARVDVYAEKLSKMVQKETISDRADPTVEKFREFHVLLEELFPTVFAKCEKVEIDGNLLLKKGKPQADSALRDTENVPLTEDIEEYFAREVLPFAPDAWIDKAKSKVGYEIPFTRYFYKYEAPRPSAEIMAEILEIEKELDGALAEVFA